MADVAGSLAIASTAAERLRASMGHRATYSRRQEEILDALEAALLERGFRDTTIEEMVSIAHCSRGTLYDLASSKDELLLLVLDRMWRRLGERTREAALEAADTATQIEAFLCEAAVIFRPSSAWKFFEDVNAYPPARRLFEEHLAIGTQFVAVLVADGVRRGEFRPVDPLLAAALLTSGAGQIAHEEFWDEQMGIVEAVREAIRMVLWGLVDRDADPHLEPPAPRLRILVSDRVTRPPLPLRPSHG